MGYQRCRCLRHGPHEKECYDAFQSLEYEVNTLHTANGQTSFVTFGFGLGDSWQSRLIQRAILRNRIAGLGKNKKTAVFPKLVFAIKDGLNREQGDPRTTTSSSWRSSALPADVSGHPQLRPGGQGDRLLQDPMGCRSFLGLRGARRAVHEGRNNLGVVSLQPATHRPEIRDEADFWEKRTPPRAAKQAH
ncbi:anaerobic ribonucleoside-triphosphate reductase [Shigella flexneri]